MCKYRYVTLAIDPYLRSRNLFYPENQTEKTCNGCHAGNSSAAQVARDAGIKLHLWTNIRMASNTSNVVAEDPTMDFRLFPDSLQRDAAGNLLPCWDGFSMNPDTRVGSFGKFQLQRIKNWVTNFSLDGIFLDFYGDTTDVDVSRRYGQFPFYPMQVTRQPSFVGLQALQLLIFFLADVGRRNPMGEVYRELGALGRQVPDR